MAAIEIKAPDGWIPVEERLPEDGESVVIWLARPRCMKWMTLAWYDEANSCWHDNLNTGSIFDEPYSMEDVAAWVPINWTKPCKKEVENEAFD